MLVQPKEIFKDAIEKNYCLGAFNVANLEMVQAVIGAAEKERSGAVIMISMGARKYAGDFELFVETVKRYADKSAMPFIVHHDHCKTPQNCREAVDAGVQSVMFDGSHFAFEENIAKTREVAEYAHEHGVWVEAELGSLPGFEDEVFGENAVFTDPDTVCEFIERSGCDSLAIAAGTSHGGVKGDDYLTLDIERVKQIHALMPDYPFVLHGSASLPPALIDECNRWGGTVEYLRNCSEAAIRLAAENGIRKANMDVDNFLAFTTAIRRFFMETSDQYDPRKYLAPAREAFMQEVRHKMSDVLQSAGRY